MRKLYILLSLLAYSGPLFSQSKPRPLPPFIIQGQLTNVPEKKIGLQYHYDDGFVNEDIDVDANGRFYLKTSKFTKPCMAILGKNGSLISYIYIAPGYNLTLTGDGKDYQSLVKTKKITGYGATANKYLCLRDSIWSARQTKAEWFQLDAKQLLAFANSQKKTCDSIARIVFNKKNPPDSYYNFFKEKTLLNIKFDKLYYLINHAIDDKKFTYSQANDYVINNFEPGLKNIHYNPSDDFLRHPTKPGILDNLYDKEFAISDSYRGLMYGDYYIYLWEEQYRKDSTKVDNKRFNIDFVRIIAQNYKGGLKPKVLYSKIYSIIRYSRSFEELNDYKKALPPYVAQIPEKEKRNNIDKLLADKEAELLKTAIGRPAPIFSAEDSTGKSYSLADFKGKVVYLDLWASWCGPCRQETPYLKKIVEKYKSDGRLAIIGIAVLDKLEKWKAAMAEDKPNCLQLFDKDGSVQAAYVANSIPKFIIINKQGKIVNLDAEGPHSCTKLEAVLNEEMAKN